MVTDNIDLNIWDKVAYETNGEHRGGWQMRAYAIECDGAGYGTGHMTTHVLELRPKDVDRMGLDMMDDDFFIDGKTIAEDYNTPRRVRVWIEQTIEKVARGIG